MPNVLREQRWAVCKKLLVVRADNMGDVIMSGPAIRACKSAWGCHITLLTSSQGAGITPYMPCVDAVIVADLPWVKTQQAPDAAAVGRLIKEIEGQAFDAAIIFSVYSQTALPTALCLFQAGVPLRLAYAHENPYGLLTDWKPDHEPFEEIRHQVMRDLGLLSVLGINHAADDLLLKDPAVTANAVSLSRDDDAHRPLIVIHPGVSERKREYPAALWQEVIALCRSELAADVVVTGTAGERVLAESIIGRTPGCVNLAGTLSVGDWIGVIDRAQVVICVNSAASHVAAARKKPVVVLYADTNPQHTPWKTRSVVKRYSVPPHLRSKNPLIRFVDKGKPATPEPPPSPRQVIQAVVGMLIDDPVSAICPRPEMDLPVG